MASLFAPEPQDDWFSANAPMPASPAAAPAALPPASPAAPAGPQPGSNTDPNAFGQAWQASGGRTVADLKNFIAAHPEFGASAGGSKGDKVTIGGRTFDAVQSAGTGGIAATWNDITNGDGGQTLANMGQSFNAPPPFTEQFSYAPWTEQFQAPSYADAMNDPGVQYQLKEAQNALERSAASRGTLLTTGTLKDLGQQQQGIASQAYGDVYNRRLGEYGQKKADYLTNYNKALGEYGQRYGISQGQFGNAIQGNAANQMNLMNAFGMDLNNRQFGLQQQGQNFNQGYSLANLGQQSDQFNQNLGFQYANLYGNTLMNGANATNEYGLQGANAGAAGTIGASNAWNQGIGNLANMGLDYAAKYQSGYRPPGYGTSPR